MKRQFGIPAELLPDNGPELSSVKFQNLLKITALNSPPSHHITKSQQISRKSSADFEEGVVQK